MKKKGFVLSEIGLWIVAIILLIVVIIFLINLPFLRWIGFLPDGPNPQNDSLVGDIGDDKFIGVSENCIKKAGTIERSGGGMLTRFGEAVRLRDDKRAIKINREETPFYFYGNDFGNAEIYLAFGDVKIGDMKNGKIILDKDVFDETSRLRWKIWENYLYKISESGTEIFNEQISALYGTEVVKGGIQSEGILLCLNEAIEAPQIKTWPESEGKERLYIDKVSSKDNFFIQYFDMKQLKEEDISYIYLKEKDDVLLINGKKDGLFGIDILKSDSSVGVIFNDGSLWMRKNYYTKLNTEKDSKVVYYPNLKLSNILSSPKVYFQEANEIDLIKTNIYVKENILIGLK